MPLPSNLEDLNAMKAILNGMWSRILKKNIDMFDEYAEDASKLVNAKFGKTIISYHRALLSKNHAKITEAREKCKLAFVTIGEKVKERIVKVKELQKKRKVFSF